MKKNLYGLLTFSIALLFGALLVAGNLFVYQLQKKEIFAEFENAQATELKLLEQFAREGLITQNYALIEWFFQQWGQEYNKVVSLSLHSQQGYSLINYQRAVAAESDMLVSSKRIKLHDGIYHLKMSSDTVGLERKLDSLLVQLFMVTVGTTMLLVILLWFVFQTVVMRHLQHEGKRRLQVERKLASMEAGED